MLSFNRSAWVVCTPVGRALQATMLLWVTSGAAVILFFKLLAACRHCRAEAAAVRISCTDALRMRLLRLGATGCRSHPAQQSASLVCWQPAGIIVLRGADVRISCTDALQTRSLRLVATGCRSHPAQQSASLVCWQPAGGSCPGSRCGWRLGRPA